MTQNSNIYLSTLKLKCPHCHEGDLFSNKNPYKLNGFLDMPSNCKKCNQDFEIEAGFYLGAMFVSYGLTIAISVAVFVAFITFSAYSLTPYLIATGICLTVTTPFILRISRSIWIAFNVNYNPSAIEDYAKQNNSK